jgi:hypothetical protein
VSPRARAVDVVGHGIDGYIPAGPRRLGVGPLPACVAGQQAESDHGRMHTDVEVRQGSPPEAGPVPQAFLVSQKISAISSILASSSSALPASSSPLVPEAPASFVASFTRVCSWGYFSKCGGLK